MKTLADDNATVSALIEGSANIGKPDEELVIDVEDIDVDVYSQSSKGVE